MATTIEYQTPNREHDMADRQAHRCQLGGFQQVMLRWEEIRPYNAVHILEVRGLGLSPGTLASSVSAVLEEVGLNAVEFDSARKNVQLGVSSPPEQVPPLVEADTSLPSLSSIMSDRLTKTFRNETPCPYQFELIQGPGDRQYIVLLYRHVIADAQSSILIVKAILDHYRGLDFSASDLTFMVPRPKQLFAADVGFARSIPRVRKLSRELLQGILCARPKSKEPGNKSETCLIHQTGLESAKLKSAASQYGVSVQDFVMAAQVEAMAEVFNSSPTTRLNPRKLLAVTSMVDLRRFAPETLNSALGQFLGMLAVRPSARRASDFRSLVEFVNRQNTHAKQHREFFWAINSMSMMARVWDCLPLDTTVIANSITLGNLVRRLYPFVCALSNMNLGFPIHDDISDGTITDYFRGANLGVLVPLMLSNTTVGETFNLCTTHKDAVYSEDEVRQFADCICRRIARP